VVRGPWSVVLVLVLVFVFVFVFVFVRVKSLVLYPFSRPIPAVYPLYVRYMSAIYQNREGIRRVSRSNRRDIKPQPAAVGPQSAGAPSAFA
jgi:hypothetical protein